MLQEEGKETERYTQLKTIKTQAITKRIWK